ncbi:MAG: peptide ABC transporter substrate-binding protein [Clostridia bacterium]|nr:peptide ABC transporter substrate-binding protein [Clostridia bacterium]
MKRILALILCAVFALTAFVGCSRAENDRGAIIHMLLSSEIKNFDPATAYVDSDAVKILGLLYEGLTRIDANGKVVNAMAKDITIDEDKDRGEYKMLIELKPTKWSDGTAVTADDFIFAWKRILTPDFSSDAAVLLYDIKNAKPAKEGQAGVSVDDIGITAPDSDLLEIEFEQAINYDHFLELLASPALVPLREDKVSKPLTDDDGVVQYDENDQMLYDTTWATKATMMVTNGPFAIKKMDEEKANGQYTLERNKYYRLKGEDGENELKFVKPHKIILHYEYFAKDGAGIQGLLDQFNNGDIFYLSNLPLDQIANYKDDMKKSDLFSTHTFMFNRKNELFDSKDVRVALSKALDRNEIVALTGGINTAATGIVPTPVYNTKYKTSFRGVQGDVISASADFDSAKSLAKAASGDKSIKIVCRDYTVNGVDELVAKYAEEKWEALGFSVTVKALNRKEYAEAYKTGDYDVISVDYQSNSTDAIGTLAPFAIEYSGAARDTLNNNYDPVPNMSGYASEAYSNLIKEALALAPYSEERATKLAEAEKLLMEDMAIIPLQFYTEYYLSKDMSGIGSSIFGYRVFNKTKLKNYERFLETEEV